MTGVLIYTVSVSLTRRFGSWKRVVALFPLCYAAVPLPAQTFTTLVSFDGANGDGPVSPLVQGTDGSLYGTTSQGGANSCPAPYNGCGTIFKMTVTGTLTMLHSFNSMDGALPASLVQANNGTFYGSTVYGGANANYGTIFRFSPPKGTLTTLHSFDSADGSYPTGGMVQATNGSFYGTAQQGGANGFGTVFRITPAGSLTTLYSFDRTDGADPLAGLVQAANGDFYGTTLDGGDSNGGVVFRITSGGTLTTMHSFDYTDGATPYGWLIQATNGSFYGTTLGGGAFSYGTVFRISPAGSLTTLYSFDRTDGASPQVGLMQATDGNLYGTTSAGGNSSSCYAGCGTVFKITPSGKMTTLYTFNSLDGANPGGLVQATDGNLYGTAGGGADGCGTIFRLSVGLGPFVKTLPASAKVGAAISILGTNLTGSTGVTFNGTAAAFTVVSQSLIRATVPTGATTGKVQVVTPNGTLSSNLAFRIR